MGRKEVCTARPCRWRLSLRPMRWRLRLLLLLLLRRLLLLLLLGLLLGGGLLRRIRKLAWRHGMGIVGIHMFGEGSG
jgi:hypothetical protein